MGPSKSQNGTSLVYFVMEECPFLYTLIFVDSYRHLLILFDAFISNDLLHRCDTCCAPRLWAPSADEPTSPRGLRCPQVRHELRGRVACVVDHGADPEGRDEAASAPACRRAGRPRYKEDRLSAQQVSWAQTSKHALRFASEHAKHASKHAKHASKHAKHA